MVFIPSATGLDKGQVFIVGGLNRLEVDTGKSFPFVLNEADARNDFVIFDESQHLQPVASRHIGLSVSSGALRFNLQRLWNPRTKKGLLGTLRQGTIARHVAESMEEADQLFNAIEATCDVKHEQSPQSQRDWRELRIRQADLVEDTVSQLSLIHI